MSDSLRVVVSGASGFIGGKLVSYLASNGHRVLAVASRIHNESASTQKSTGLHQIFPSDSIVVMAEKIRIFGATHVVHAATHFTPDSSPAEITRVLQGNLDFSIKFFEAARLAAAREFVNLNSFWQLPEINPGPEAFRSPYSATKAAFSTYLKLRSEGVMRVRQVYLGDTFGVGDTRQKLVAYIVSQLKNSKIVELRNPDTPLLLANVGRLTSFIQELLLEPNLFAEETIYVNYLGETPESLKFRLESLIRGAPAHEHDVGQRRRPSLPKGIELVGLEPQENLDLDLRELLG